MTLRLSAFFESHMKTVMSNYKASIRRAAKTKNNSGSGSPNKGRLKATRINEPRMKKNCRVTSSTDDDEDMRSMMSHNLQMDDDDDHDDDDDDDMQHPRPSGLQTSRRNVNNTRGAAASASGSNRVTSSCSTRRLASQLDAAVRARRSKRHLNNRDNDDEEHENERVGRVQSTTEAEEDDEDEEVDDDEEEEDTEESSDSSAATSNDSDEDDEEDPLEPRKRRRGKQKQFDDDDYGAEDSEESYKPNRHQRRGNNKVNRSSKKKKQHKQHKQQRRQRGRPFKTYIDELDVDVDDENDEDYVEQTEKRVNNKRKLNGQRTIVNGVSNSNLQTADEATQEATTNSARKRGRPSKQVTSSNDLDDGPSTSASALRRLRTEHNEVETSPQGRTRRRLANDTVTNAATLENNDHSYHLPVRNGRLIDSDTDSREMLARPTRASVKRAILDWARSSDVEEAEDEDVDLQTTAPGSATKINGGQRGRPYSVNNHVANTNGGSRQLRRNRNSTNDRNANDNDDYAVSDDEPLSQHCSQANQTSRSSNSQRRVSTPLVNTTHMTRSHTAISSTSSTSMQSIRTMPAVHDHNYLGDIGPSTSGTSQRNMQRRVLSRHQRNADELDNTIDEVDSSLLRRIRRMPSSTSNEPRSQEQQQRQPVVRRGRSRYSQENSQSTEGGDNENLAEAQQQEPLDNLSIASDEGTGGGTVTPCSLASEDDSEDNQPLTAILPSSNNRGKSNNHARENNRTRTTRSRQASDSLPCEQGEVDGVEDEENEHELNVDVEEEEEYGRKKRRKHKQQQTNVRQTRLQKRPRYNEQSDEEEDVGTDKRQRYETVTSNTNNHNGIAHDDDSEELTDDSDEQLVSVSSRGRIRKLTAKARGIRNNW